MSAIFTSTSPAATELATSVGCTPTTNPSLTLGASSSSSPSYSKTQASTQTGLPDPVQYADALTSELGKCVAVIICATTSSALFGIGTSKRHW
eukprot:scaffold125999_cov25-Tisochrysis_lutea.AAC.2